MLMNLESSSNLGIIFYVIYFVVYIMKPGSLYWCHTALMGETNMNIELWWMVYNVSRFLHCVLETEYNKRSYLTLLLYWIMSSDVS